MSLVFYYAPWSSAMTSLWALKELAVECELRKMDLGEKETFTPEFLALNPNGKVPLLVHDGVPLFESIAILAHLGECFGVERKLFPPAGIERGLAFQWLAWANVSLGATFQRAMSNSSPHVPEEMRNAKVAEAAKTELGKLLGLLERHLTGRSWMVGDSFTLVDAHLAGAITWISRSGADMKGLVNIEDWATRCRARPAFAAAMAA